SVPAASLERITDLIPPGVSDAMAAAGFNTARWSLIQQLLCTSPWTVAPYRILRSDGPGADPAGQLGAYRVLNAPVRPKHDILAGLDADAACRAAREVCHASSQSHWDWPHDNPPRRRVQETPRVAAPAVGPPRLDLIVHTVGGCHCQRTTAGCAMPESTMSSLRRTMAWPASVAGRS